MEKLVTLSKDVRKELLESQIARENKTFRLKLCTLRQSLESNENLEKLYKRIETRVQIADKLQISVERHLRLPSNRMLGEELATLVSRMPERFHEGKIILIANNVEK